MIKVGDKLPEATLNELTVEYTAGCPAGPGSFKVPGQTQGKHLPGHVPDHAEAVVTGRGIGRP